MSSSLPVAPPARWQFWFPAILALVALWWVLIDQLHTEWTINPQYGYGWAVPFLCAYLAWKAWMAAGDRESSRDLKSDDGSLGWVFVVVVLLFLPLRLVQIGCPQWRLTNWAVASAVIGLTLLGVRLALGSEWLKRLAFPICYMFVAVPWPSRLEWPLIKGLTGLNVAVTIEILNWLGLPALQHGNMIEIGTGVVGVDQACSGIRSVQATLMISLFLGELYRLTVARRFLFCLAGFLMAFVFNIGRTWLLVTVASKKGVGAIAAWHDPAGISILVACFLGLWGLGLRLKPGSVAPGGQPSRAVFMGPRTAVSGWWPSFVLAWVVFSLAAVEGWYRLHERDLPKNAVWVAAPPASNSTVQPLPMSEGARVSLSYDEGTNFGWHESDGTRWQMIFLRWKPGRVAAHLARGHTPELCLATAGNKVQAVSAIKTVPVHGISLPFRTYTAQRDGHTFHVFYCLWQDRAEQQYFETEDILSWRRRLANVWAGQRNLGQRSVEIALWGVKDAAEAEAKLALMLPKLITVQASPGN